MSRRTVPGRVTRSAKAGIDALPDRAGDPQKTLDQLIRDELVRDELIRDRAAAGAQGRSWTGRGCARTGPGTQNMLRS